MIDVKSSWEMFQMKKDGLGFERLLIFLTGLNLIMRIVLYIQEKREANEED